MSILDFVLVIIFSALCILAMQKKEFVWIQSSKTISQINRFTNRFIQKYHIPITIVIFLTAIFIRVYKFGTVPYGFNQDEAMAALEGFSLSEYGTDHYGMTMPVYFTAWITSQMNVLLSYIMIPFIKILGSAVLAARLPLLIFSLISLWVIYRFSCKLIHKNAALFILFFAAINPWQIMMSRWALEANLFPHFMLYGAYFLYLGLEKKKYLYLSMVLFGLAMYSYGISYYAVPLFLLTLCTILLCRKMITIKQALISFAIYMVISLSIFLMVAVNYFRWDTMELLFLTIPFFKDGQRMNDILFFSENIYPQFVDNFNASLRTAIFQTEDLPWNSIASFGPLYFYSIPLFITGIYCFIKKKFTIVLMMFVIAFVSGTITNSVNINRINTIFIPMIFFIGYAAYIIYNKFKFLLVPMMIVFITFFVSFSNEYINGKHADTLKTSFFYGYGECLRETEEMDYDELRITTVINGQESAFTAELMALFHLGIDNKYYRNEASLTDENGSTYPPYSERYRYFNFSQSASDAIDTNNPQIIYVIAASEKELFDSLYFEFQKIGNYYLVTHADYADAG